MKNFVILLLAVALLGMCGVTIAVNISILNFAVSLEDKLFYFFTTNIMMVSFIFCMAYFLYDEVNGIED